MHSSCIWNSHSRVKSRTALNVFYMLREPEFGTRRKKASIDAVIFERWKIRTDTLTQHTPILNKKKIYIHLLIVYSGWLCHFFFFFFLISWLLWWRMLKLEASNWMLPKNLQYSGFSPKIYGFSLVWWSHQINLLSADECNGMRLITSLWWRHWPHQLRLFENDVFKAKFK